MTEQELRDCIVAILDRGDYVAGWPEDERSMFRSYFTDHPHSTFAARNRAVQEFRARKIIELVRRA